MELKTILGYELQMSCKVLYLCSLTSESVQCEDTYLVKILLAATKKAVTRKWCREEPPTLRNWLDIVEKIFDMERLTHILRLQVQFNTKWYKWTMYKSHNRDSTGD